jgi:hypothetical protein
MAHRSFGSALADLYIESSADEGSTGVHDAAPALACRRRATDRQDIAQQFATSRASVGFSPAPP